MKATLKECCNLLIDGDWIESKDQSTAGLRLIQTGNVGNGQYLEKQSRAKYISEETFIRLGCTEVFPGDILISRLPEPVGRACIIPQKPERMITAVDCSILRVNERIIDRKYLLFFLQSQSYFNQLTGKLAGTTRVRISRKNLEKVYLPIPGKRKQAEIAGVLSRVTDIKTVRQKQLNALDDLIKARFVEMFGDIKDTCDVGYYIQSLIAGKSLAGEAECENKVLKTGAASFDYFDATQVKNLPLDYEPQAEHLVNKGDIIISRMNTAELTGAAAYVWDVPPKVYLPDRLWKAILRDGYNPIFVWQMLIQPSTKEQIRRECSGTSGSMKNISKPGMLSIKVKKVPVDLQNEFAAFVVRVDKSKVAVQKTLDKAQLLFDSLMQQYFG